MLLVAVVLLLCGCANDRPVMETGTIVSSEETCRCIVQVHAANQDGCGVICKVDDESLLIATVAHIFPETEKPYEVTVTFPDGESYPATETIYDAARDVSILKVDRKIVPADSYCVAVLKEEGSAEQESTDAMVLYAAYDGYHSIDAILLDEAFQMEEDAPGFPKGTVILAAGQAARGMSGGGLFDKAGNLLGILAGGTTEGHLVAVPLETYETYLREFE
ncbi:MAG: serine protease [Lachnospiraceae bacterium]|nr:serine protease [Lachnospiraceae bacterium]